MFTVTEPEAINEALFVASDSKVKLAVELTSVLP